MGMWHSTKPGSCWAVSPLVLPLCDTSPSPLPYFHFVTGAVSKSHRSKSTGSPIRLPLAGLERIRVPQCVGIWKTGRKIQAVLLPSHFGWVSGVCTQERVFTAGCINKMWRSATQVSICGILASRASLWSFGLGYFLCSHQTGLGWDEWRNQAASAFVCMQCWGWLNTLLCLGRALLLSLNSENISTCKSLLLPVELRKQQKTNRSKV